MEKVTSGKHSQNKDRVAIFVPDKTVSKSKKK